jgi:hypothetical protein
LNAHVDSAEYAAAQHVVTVMGGEFEIHDTGTEPGQYDVDIKRSAGVSVALEVTSFGGDDWKRTAARVRKQVERGDFTGEGLHHQWWVIFPTGIGLREIEEPLTEVLLRLEKEGKGWATKRYEGDDTTLTEVAEILSGLPVNSVSVFDPDPSPHEPRILLSQSDSSTGSAGALPAALAAVFKKGDNQQKLARAKADERHLYVFMEDNGASAVLEGAWPLPACPEEPTGVIDTLWVYCPSVSSHLFRTRPGSDKWERFIALTGVPA